MRSVFAALAMLLSAAPGVLAQTPDFHDTVNEVTPAQEARAKAAITRAGYRPTVLEFAQAGNLFFTVTKGGDVYEATVTPQGAVFVSTGLPASSASG